MMEAVANDENVRPLELNGPSDSDRARFGFRRRTPQKAGSVEASPAKACMQNGPAASIQEATGKVLTPVRSLVMNGSRPDVAPRPCSTAALADAEPVKRLDLVALFDGELGDLDAAQAMLKLKPRAGRYDFKDQIEELRNVIRPLKEALAERLRRQAAARDAIAAHQTTIDGYVASLDMRIAHSDRLINEKLAQERELNSQKVQKLRQQVLETERAWQQKELVQERAVAERDRETEELHRQSLGRVQGELQDSKDAVVDSHGERRLAGKSKGVDFSTNAIENTLFGKEFEDLDKVDLENCTAAEKAQYQKERQGEIIQELHKAKAAEPAASVANESTATKRFWFGRRQTPSVAESKKGFLCCLLFRKIVVAE